MARNARSQDGEKLHVLLLTLAGIGGRRRLQAHPPHGGTDPILPEGIDSTSSEYLPDGRAVHRMQARVRSGMRPRRGPHCTFPRTVSIHVAGTVRTYSFTSTGTRMER